MARGHFWGALMSANKKITAEAKSRGKGSQRGSKKTAKKRPAPKRPAKKKRKKTAGSGRSTAMHPAVKGKRKAASRKRARPAEPARSNATLHELVAERTSALAVLRDVASMANQAQNVEAAFRYCLRRIAEHNGWCCGHAFLPAADDPDKLLLAYHWCAEPSAGCRDCREPMREIRLGRGQGLPGRVFATGRALWTDDIAEESKLRGVDFRADLGVRTSAAFPVALGDRTVAVLEFFSRGGILPDEQMLEGMASVGMQLGRVIERKQSQDRLLTIADDEQRRIGQDLHDDVGQELLGLSLKVETLAETLGGREGPERELAAEILAALDRVRRTIRGLSQSLVPVEIDPSGLEDALEELALRTGQTLGVDCTFTASEHARVADPRHATQLYRIAQEAVSNAVRHGKAGRVRLGLEPEEDACMLAIEDDGVGFSPDKVAGRGMGLRTMRDRATFIGAELVVGPGPKGGTRVACRLPVTPTAITDRPTEQGAR
jgi:signal transduction histidine kinase